MHAELLIDGHFLGGPCDQSIGKQLVRNPFDGSVVGTAAEGDLSELRGAITAAHDAFLSWRFSARHERQKLLRTVASLARDRKHELSDLLTREVGKPVTWAEAEVDRLALTFDLAADLVSSYGFESLPVDIDPRGQGHRLLVERVPIGVVFAMAPYNWPYNLAAHKIAPALATGNTVVLKASPLAPISTLTLARLVHEAGCPPGVLNAWNGPTRVVEALIDHPDVKMLSFTGSAAVGWMLKRQMNDRKVLLELGGNASAIVQPDADLAWATKRIVAGGFGYAGQVCISVQHVLVHREVYEEMSRRLTEATAACPTGDPLLDETVCGPLISVEAAEKVEGFVVEAVAAGAKILAGGSRVGAMMQPTLLTDVPDSVRLANEEVFGPVIALAPYASLEEAVGLVNRSKYGIHCGLFTHDARSIDFAFRKLDIGGLIVNDYPTLRFDNMPYGGVKCSGFGREGVRYAMDEMTEPKALLTRLGPFS
jgi:acyl-CoA reductase-like NAD-dependent aldehyde dehydrogenase